MAKKRHHEGGIPLRRSGAGAGCGAGTEPAPAQAARPAVDVGHGSVEDVIEALAAQGLPCTGCGASGQGRLRAGDDVHNREPPVMPVHFFSKEQAAAYERNSGGRECRGCTRRSGARSSRTAQPAPGATRARIRSTRLGPAQVSRPLARSSGKSDSVPRAAPRRGGRDARSRESGPPTVWSRNARAPRPPVRLGVEHT
jgi:hypothetical protein